MTKRVLSGPTVRRSTPDVQQNTQPGHTNSNMKVQRVQLQCSICSGFQVISPKALSFAKQARFQNSAACRDFFLCSRLTINRMKGRSSEATWRNAALEGILNCRCGWAQNSPSYCSMQGVQMHPEKRFDEMDMCKEVTKLAVGGRGHSGFRHRPSVIHIGMGSERILWWAAEVSNKQRLAQPKKSWLVRQNPRIVRGRRFLDWR